MKEREKIKGAMGTKESLTACYDAQASWAMEGMQ